jgi:hypothetical protein
MDTSSLLDLETKAARISATLDLRPDLAAIWRQCVAFSEAGANLSLEDIHVSEVDILSVVLGDTIMDGDTQSARIAETVYRTILSPGYILSDPGYVFDRAHQAGRMSSLVDIDKGGRASFPQTTNDPEWTEARELFVRGAPRLLRAGGPISLKSISVASLMSEISPERHPIAERLIMMSSESFLRQDLSLRDPLAVTTFKELSAPRHAYWTLAPAMSLTTGAFRSWSPATVKGQSDLINGLSRSLSREAGRIGEINSWMTKLKAEFGTGSGKSNKPAFAEFMFANPIFDSASVQRALKVSDKTARNLTAEAQKKGLIAELSARRAYRIWGVSPIKTILKDRTTTRDIRRPRSSAHEATALRAQPPKEPLATEEEMNKKLDDILAGLDDVMEATNKVLDKYISRRTRDIQ